MRRAQADAGPEQVALVEHYARTTGLWADGLAQAGYERVLTFADVDEIQERFGIHPSLVFVDAGYATYDVYRECARRARVPRGVV